MHVLFVCTGNICRSPTGERLAAAYTAAQQIPGLTASSAGTRAVIGHAIRPSATDLIIAMTRSHRDAVLELAPTKLHRTFTLAEASTLASRYHARNIADLANLRPRLIPAEAPDILDPIGQDHDVFAAVGQQIADLLPPVLELCRPE